MLIGNNREFAYVNSYIVSGSCWCDMRTYLLSCGLGINSMKNSSSMMYEDNKLLKNTKESNFDISYVQQKTKQLILNK